MKLRRQFLTWRHARVAGVTYVVMGVFAYLAFPRSWKTGASVVFGPFAGPAMRRWRHSLDWAWTLAPWAFGLLAAGLIVQWWLEPTTRPRRIVRMTAWGIACAGWCAFALLSYGVALE
ncbi:MAG TPA: hypothetical protein VGC54_12960 [Planctomycetota bacterium]